MLWNAGMWQDMSRAGSLTLETDVARWGNEQVFAAHHRHSRRRIEPVTARLVQLLVSEIKVDGTCICNSRSPKQQLQARSWGWPAWSGDRDRPETKIVGKEKQYHRSLKRKQFTTASFAKRFKGEEAPNISSY